MPWAWIEPLINELTHVTSATLMSAPHTLSPQTSSDPPESVGFSFAADALKRVRQLIIVVREQVTSFTVTLVIPGERHATLGSSLLSLCIPLRPMDGPCAIIRTDPAPGFKSLVNDDQLTQYHLCIELGRAKNLNKNPVAEKAIQELGT